MDPGRGALVAIVQRYGPVGGLEEVTEGVPVSPSIEELVAARGDALLRFALMLSGDAHRAEDLVQSALARAYPRWRRIAEMDAPEAYLKRMVVNEHLRWRARRSSREVPVAVPASDPVAEG